MFNKNNVHFCSRTHKGKVRRNNQDFLAVDQDLLFAAIADGIGGKDFGEVASQLAVESCVQYAQSISDELQADSLSRELANAIKVANETIITIQRNESKYRNMGSTLSCFWLYEQQLHYSWVGDSRIYLLQPVANQIKMLTQDHTLDQRKIDAKLAPSLHKRASSILTQMVGSILLLKPDSDCIQVNQGDIILACTDGLTDRVSEELILEYSQTIDARDQQSIELYADKLLDRALDCGGQDNISLIVAQL